MYFKINDPKNEEKYKVKKKRILRQIKKFLKKNEELLGNDKIKNDENCEEKTEKPILVEKPENNDVENLGIVAMI